MKSWLGYGGLFKSNISVLFWLSNGQSHKPCASWSPSAAQEPVAASPSSSSSPPSSSSSSTSSSASCSLPYVWASHGQGHLFHSLPLPQVLSVLWPKDMVWLSEASQQSHTRAQGEWALKNSGKKTSGVKGATARKSPDPRVAQKLLSGASSHGFKSFFFLFFFLLKISSIY